MAQLKDNPSWQFMVKGRTTIPEQWDGGGSWNHHALASPLDTWLYTTLAGIQPDESAPGFAHIVFAAGSHLPGVRRKAQSVSM
jgi:alpha-L-rhamnosidase